MTVAEELCDRVALIVDGRIVLVNTPRQLKLQYGVSSVRVETGLNGGSIVSEFPAEGLGCNQEFLKLIRENPLQTIHSLEATLEDVFIQVTGRRLT